MENNIKSVREAKGITQYRLAKLTGIKQQTLSRYELNTRIPVYEYLLKIAAVLECKIEDIYKP